MQPAGGADRAAIVRGIAALCLAVISTFANADDAGELRARLETTHGRERVDVLNALSKASWGVSSDETIAWADQAIDESRRLGYDAGEACGLRYKGIGYWYRDEYDTALELVLEALRIYERIGDTQGIAGSLSTAGTIYLNLERYDQALETYQRALALAEKTGDENRVGIVLSNLGTTYLGMNRHEDALVEFRRALPILERTGSTLDVLTALGNIGGAYRRLGRLDEALAVNADILERAERAGSKVRMADALTDTAEILMMQGRHAEAEPNVRRAVEIARSEGLKRNEHEAEQVWAQLSEARGDDAAALAHLKRVNELRGEIFSEENARAIADLRLKYEAEKVEKELAAQQLVIERQKSARNLLVGVSLLVLVLAVANWGRYRAKRRENLLLERLSRTDTLTGLANRRAILESLEREYRRMQRDGRPFSLILIDVDHFKKVNDRFGHEVGDEVLVRVAESARSSVRDVDEVARWGGEEFLVLLPECELQEAVEVAERVREGIRALEIAAGGEELRVSATFGVSMLAQGESVEDCRRRADLCLYAGKEQGRNRVVSDLPREGPAC